MIDALIVVGLTVAIIVFGLVGSVGAMWFWEWIDRKGWLP